MIDPAALLDKEMDRQAEENYQEPITARRLEGQMAQANHEIQHLTREERQAYYQLVSAQNIVAYSEAMAIDQWIAGVPEADRKRLIGSNEEERARNRLIRLAQDQAVTKLRCEALDAQMAWENTAIRLEAMKRRLSYLQSLAWAYGGECNARSAAGSAVPTRAEPLPIELVKPHKFGLLRENGED